MYSSDSARPIAPTMIRISPTVVSEIPETVAVTAYRRIAPTAIRNMEVPSGTLQPPSATVAKATAGEQDYSRDEQQKPEQRADADPAGDRCDYQHDQK
jgi:hypothetical protein